LLFITPGTRAPADTLRLVQAALDGGVQVLLLRERQLDGAARAALGHALAAEVRRAGARLLVHTDVDLALACGAEGVQLGFDGGSVAQARARAPQLLVGRSAHWPLQPDDLAADFVLLSPFRATHASRPRPLLRDGLVRAALADLQPAPVFALGGLGAADVPTLPAGLAGMAVIRAIADAQDPRAAAAVLRAALDARSDAACGVLR